MGGAGMLSFDMVKSLYDVVGCWYGYVDVGM